MSIEKDITRLVQFLNATPKHIPDFYRGTIVTLDTGALGIVASDTNEDGETPVYYLENDEIKGPAMGYELEVFYVSE